MAQPARRAPVAEESPPIDPRAIDRAYHHHRARRKARVQHRRSVRNAHVRFWVFLLVLIAATVVLAVIVWHQIQRLFGL